MPGLVLKFPTNVEMDATTQEYSRDAVKLQGQTILGQTMNNTQRVEWDELDNERGRTSVHTMDTDPIVKGRPGSALKSYEPIPHKEAELVKESEMLKARAWGTLGGVISIEDLVMERFRAAMGKDDITIEVEIWSALSGALSINENGFILSETFPIQEFTPTIAWDQVATATPLKDFNAIKLLFRGTGASAQGAQCWVNAGTFNKLLENTNADDLRGFNVENFKSAAFDLDQFNKLLEARGLPVFKIYDEGWYDDAGNFQLFIPTGKAIIIGRRPPGQPVGEYKTTQTLHRNVNGVPAPGRFAFITTNDKPNAIGMTTVSLADLGAGANPNIKVVHGVYGGPVIKYPRSVVKVNAF